MQCIIHGDRCRGAHELVASARGRVPVVLLVRVAGTATEVLGHLGRGHPERRVRRVAVARPSPALVVPILADPPVRAHAHVECMPVCERIDGHEKRAGARVGGNGRPWQ